MVSFEELASYVCFYGGSSYEELDELERNYFEGFRVSQDERLLKKSRDFCLIKQMLLDGVEFIKHEISGGFYYEPKVGWNILNEYINDGYLPH
ncbi:MAG TPA: hypothetical protein VJ824_01320 [Bacillota bacterium]|nr:hypothetical protein [Bacillota bacterium]